MIYETKELAQSRVTDGLSFSKLILSACIILWLASQPLAATAQQDCKDWDSKDQTTMNICSYEEFKKADGELNKVWKTVRSKILERDDGRAARELPNWPEALDEAQQSWIKYRDSHCLTERVLWHGGSIAPLMHATCATYLTNLRIKELQGLFER